MQTSNASQESRSNHSEWYLLGEYSLSVFLSDHENGGDLTAGLLFQAVRELGIPIEYLENIELTLTGFAKEALVHFEQGSLELSGHIRVFCHKKMKDEANSAETTRSDHAEQTMEQAPIEYHSSAIMKGGWGYFIIERFGDDAGSSERTRPIVDLYLYKEGA